MILVLSGSSPHSNTYWFPLSSLCHRTAIKALSDCNASLTLQLTCPHSGDAAWTSGTVTTANMAKLAPCIWF